MRDIIDYFLLVAISALGLAVVLALSGCELHYRKFRLQSGEVVECKSASIYGCGELSLCRNGKTYRCPGSFTEEAGAQ